MSHSKKNSPIIIALEGIDGSGKTLELGRLADEMTQRGHSVLCLSFPDYNGFFGIEIGKMLSGGEAVRADTVDPKSMALWFAMDRKKTLNQIDMNYDYLILNRYVLSNAVYQGLRFENTFEAEDDWIFKLEHEQLELPIPDLYLIFDLDEESSRGNVIKKGARQYMNGEIKPDVYEKSDKLITGARGKYLEYAKRMPNARVIDCMREGVLISSDEVHRLVMDVVDGVGGSAVD